MASLGYVCACVPVCVFSFHCGSHMSSCEAAQAGQLCPGFVGRLWQVVCLPGNLGGQP